MDVDCYDVVVIGGLFGGSSVVMFLKCWFLEVWIFVVEMCEEFLYKVGEVIVEMLVFFLYCVL